MKSETTKRLYGGCHCGNLRYTLMWPTSDLLIGTRECGCSFCQKHGGAWTSHRDADLAISLVDEDTICRYRFGTKTADFLVCSQCGVVPCVVSEIDGQLFTVVNVNTLDASEDIRFSRESTDFDGEETGDRLERRKRNWIQQVTFETGPVHLQTDSPL